MKRKIIMNVNEVIPNHIRKGIMRKTCGHENRFLERFVRIGDFNGRSKSGWGNPKYIQFWKESSIILSKVLKERAKK
jgi:hypothetical protein